MSEDENYATKRLIGRENEGVKVKLMRNGQ